MVSGPFLLPSLGSNISPQISGPLFDSKSEALERIFGLSLRTYTDNQHTLMGLWVVAPGRSFGFQSGIYALDIFVPTHQSGIVGVPYLVPLLTLLLAVLERQEAFRWAAAGGGGLALVGVVVMSQGALG